MAFFYNLFVTISFVVCALLFLLVFQRHGYRVHLWVGVMFVLFTFDNLLLYMDELMPGFAVLAHSNYWAFLVASNVSGLAITFAYERVVRYQRSEGPHPVSWPFWAVLAVTYVVLGLFGESRLWARVAILALRGALPVVLILIAMRPQPGDLANPPIGRLAVWVLLAFQLLNTIEMVLVFMGVQLMPGRYVTIEAMSINAAGAIVTGMAALMPSFFAGMDAAEMMLRRSVGSPETTEGTSRMSGFPSSTILAADQLRKAELTSM